MELIKNRYAGEHKLLKDKFCLKCGNKGLIRKPTGQYQILYEKEYDRLEDVGDLSPMQCHDAALKRCEYNTYYCPFCEKGELYKGRYPMYNTERMK